MPTLGRMSYCRRYMDLGTTGYLPSSNMCADISVSHKLSYILEFAYL